MEPGTDISKKQKKSVSNENDSEKTKLCDYCQYRSQPPQKEISVTMINIKYMDDELKNYVIKHITVHSFPNLEPGLLKEDSNICIAC